MKAMMDGYSFEIAGLGLSERDREEIPEPVEFHDVKLERGSVEGDQAFYDWARQRYAELEVGKEIHRGPDYARVRLVHKRRFLWPKIWDMYDVRQKPCGLNEERTHFHCEFEFARRERWPWYRAFWWWVKEGLKRLWYGRDGKDRDDGEG